MKTIRAAERAQDDLLEIWEYVARENPESAERLLQTFREKFELLLGHPLIGRDRSEIFIGLCSFPAGRYVIFYQPMSHGTTIDRVEEKHKKRKKEHKKHMVAECVRIYALFVLKRAS
ncbi:MAG TPA: type II toxin-antitoxin system RelE/ParE family toxin [Blastocatellia bacterium]|nr:type II toxin-antitoxin system RelE/ParE family toxin [Blastocatellia bacterium]